MATLVPPRGSDWLPPLRFRLRPYLELSRSLSEALAELEARHPARPRIFTTADRNHALLKRRPR